MGVKEIKESGGVVSPSMIYLNIVRTFANATVCPHPAKQ
jgi:hypothetical protein